MKLLETIIAKIQNQFEPVYIDVKNESHKHSVPADSETHFKVTLVSRQFDSLSKVKQHQLIYKTLEEELAGTVHALALHLYTVEEWEASGLAPNSPDCMGGSK